MKKKSEKQSTLITALNNPRRFRLLKDGWIKDSYTGLEWGPSSGATMKMNEAIKFCATNGGRLPEAHELHSLVDFAKDRPATFPIFKDTKIDDWYWTGTKTSWNKSASWCVSFNYGLVYNGLEIDDCYVRPVRASQ